MKGSNTTKGDGVEQSYEKAVELYTQAAELGNTTAAGNLATIYWNGEEGIPRDRAKALDYARIAAEDGNEHALYFLGYAHLKGIVVEQDGELGMEYLFASEEAGSDDALVQLGWEFEHGDNVEIDEVRATDYYRRAAEAGNVAGTNNYAWSLWRGEGVEKDPVEAMKYARMAADQDFKNAAFLMGVINYFGAEGVEVDFDVALDYFTRAANLGHATAAFNLGIMHRNGEGMTAPDLTEAIRWMRIASERGEEAATKELELLLARVEEEAPEPEAEIYWYAIGNERVGPMTLSALREAMSAGEVNGQSYVWKDGLSDWVAANTLPELQ